MRTKEQCLVEALKYDTRTSFKTGSYGFYQTARTKGWLNEICDHMLVKKRKHTKNDCASAALSYSRRVDFKRGNSSCYYAARGNGWLDEICIHMEYAQKTHTKNSCLKIAKKYDRRIEFARKDANVYYAARHNGWLDDICDHMSYDYPEPNVVYAWKVLGKNIWKFGITSENRCDVRFNEVADANGFQLELCYHMITENARQIEKKLLSYGNKVGLPKADGYSEFREIDPKDIHKIIRSFII